MTDRVDCLACGTTSSPPSREHVFPRWLLTELGPDASMTLFKRLDDGAREQRRTQIKLDSFKLKKICECCNNGWMSELEASAKPLILAVIRGVRELGSLSEGERRILARWAGKTAIIESHRELPRAGRGAVAGIGNNSYAAVSCRCRKRQHAVG